MKDFPFLLLVLILIAAIFADDFIFTILYILIATYILSRLWASRSILGIGTLRQFSQKVFCGEEIPVLIELTNKSRLPILWLRIQESVPSELSPAQQLKQVISLGPRSKSSYSYTMKARKRGYYSIGPLFASTSDLFGFGSEQRFQGPSDELTVYPRVIHFTRVTLLCQSPMGTLPHHQPIHEDPARVTGKRDYVSGDSLRRVDWKATASTGRLQVKQYEPSVTLTTAIFLNMNRGEYYGHAIDDALELAIVVAASLSNWIVSRKQAVGLFTNGLDPWADEKPFRPLLPRKNRHHLMNILEVLARVRAVQQGAMYSVINDAASHLPWGSTLILVTGNANENLFNEFLHLHQYGIKPVLVLVGIVPDVAAVKARGEKFGFPVYHFRNERDMDIWRH